MGNTSPCDNDPLSLVAFYRHVIKTKINEMKGICFLKHKIFWKINNERFYIYVVISLLTTCSKLINHGYWVLINDKK